MVASSAIYGGTYNLLAHTMRRMGLECTFVAPDASDEELEAAFRPNTKCVFGETIANPRSRYSTSSASPPRLMRTACR